MHIVIDPVQARALTDVRLIACLHSFIAQEHSVSEVAHLWQMRVDAAYYRVRQLEALGFIRVIAERPRKGRKQKIYSAVSDEFFVPLDTIPETSLASFLEITNAHFNALMLQAQARAVHEFFSSSKAGQWGYRIGVTNDGEPNVQLCDARGKTPNLDDPGLPIIADGWPELALDFAEARAFRKELVELYQRYEGRHGARRYLVHFALAPLER